MNRYFIGQKGWVTPPLLLRAWAVFERIFLCASYLLCLFAFTGTVAAAKNNAGPGLNGSEVVAVLSSDMAPYKEALEGLNEKLGRKVKNFILPGEKPAMDGGVKVIVCLGAKAVQQDYPSGAVVVLGLAPGIGKNETVREGLVVQIGTFPRADAVIYKLKYIQPEVKSFLVVWTSKSVKGYVGEFALAAETMGINVLEERVKEIGEIPDALRKIGAGANAIWIPPDPTLLTPQVFNVFKEYSWANKLPLYTSTDWLVEKGAVASVSVTFRALGSDIGESVLKILADSNVPDYGYPEHLTVTLNLSAARETGLNIPEQALKAADRIVK